MEYSQTEIGRPLEFYRNFHAPAWTIIYHIFKAHKPFTDLTDQALCQCLKAQAMAMLLHSLDDHLADGEMPATHLTLLLRSQAWLAMNNSLDQICDENEDLARIKNEYIDRYYRSITTVHEPDTVQEYIDIFRDQMASWTLVPVLSAMLIGADEGYISRIKMAYESFGIAWRLLDDVTDLDEDLERSAPTAIPLTLSEKGRKLWRGFSSSGAGAKAAIKNNLAEIVVKTNSLDIIKAIIAGELENAADICSGIGLKSMAGQFRTMTTSIRESMTHDDT